MSELSPPPTSTTPIQQQQQKQGNEQESEVRHEESLDPTSYPVVDDISNNSTPPVFAPVVVELSENEEGLRTSNPVTDIPDSSTAIDLGGLMSSNSIVKNPSTGLWDVIIRTGLGKREIGSFPTEIEATKAYNKASLDESLNQFSTNPPSNNDQGFRVLTMGTAHQQQPLLQPQLQNNITNTNNLYSPNLIGAYNPGSYMLVSPRNSAGFSFPTAGAPSRSPIKSSSSFSDDNNFGSLFRGHSGSININLDDPRTFGSNLNTPSVDLRTLGLGTPGFDYRAMNLEELNDYSRFQNLFPTPDMTSQLRSLGVPTNDPYLTSPVGIHTMTFSGFGPGQYPQNTTNNNNSGSRPHLPSWNSDNSINMLLGSNLQGGGSVAGTHFGNLMPLADGDHKKRKHNSATDFGSRKLSRTSIEGDPSRNQSPVMNESKQAFERAKLTSPINGIESDEPKKTSRYRGVCWYKRTNKWVVQTKINGKRMHIGYFNDELEASKAYEEAVAKHRGVEEAS